MLVIDFASEREECTLRAESWSLAFVRSWFVMAGTILVGQSGQSKALIVSGVTEVDRCIIEDWQDCIPGHVFMKQKQIFAMCKV